MPCDASSHAKPCCVVVLHHATHSSSQAIPGDVPLLPHMHPTKPATSQRNECGRSQWVLVAGLIPGLAPPDVQPASSKPLQRTSCKLLMHFHRTSATLDAAGAVADTLAGRTT